MKDLLLIIWISTALLALISLIVGHTSIYSRYSAFIAVASFILWAILVNIEFRRNVKGVVIEAKRYEDLPEISIEKDE